MSKSIWGDFRPPIDPRYSSAYPEPPEPTPEEREAARVLARQQWKAWKERNTDGVPKRKILYVTSSQYHRQMWAEHTGISTTATWFQEDVDLETRKTQIMAAEGVLLYVEPNDLPLREPLVEIGIALGVRVPILVVGDTEGLGDWVHSPLVKCYKSIEDAFRK